MAENAAFTFSEGKQLKIREAPIAYFPNFIAKVADIIHQHEKYVGVHYIER